MIIREETEADRGAIRALNRLAFGGGFEANLIDRLRFDGLVIDFMNLGVGPLRSGIFNVADVAIVVGALLLAFPLSRRAPVDECQAAS